MFCNMKNKNQRQILGFKLQAEDQSKTAKPIALTSTQAETKLPSMWLETKIAPDRMSAPTLYTSPELGLKV